MKVPYCAHVCVASKYSHPPLLYIKEKVLGHARRPNSSPSLLLFPFPPLSSFSGHDHLPARSAERITNSALPPSQFFFSSPQNALPRSAPSPMAISPPPLPLVCSKRCCTAGWKIEFLCYLALQISSVDAFLPPFVCTLLHERTVSVAVHREGREL